MKVFDALSAFTDVQGGATMSELVEVTGLPLAEVLGVLSRNRMLTLTRSDPSQPLGFISLKETPPSGELVAISARKVYRNEYSRGWEGPKDRGEGVPVIDWLTVNYYDRPRRAEIW